MISHHQGLQEDSGSMWLWGPVPSFSDSVSEPGLEERHLQGRELVTGGRAHTYLWSNVLKPSKVIKCSLLSIHSGPCFSPKPHVCLVGGFLCIPCHQRMLICVSIFTLNPNGHCSGRSSFCHLRGQCSLVQRMTELSSKHMLSRPGTVPLCLSTAQVTPSPGFSESLGVWRPRLSDSPVPPALPTPHVGIPSSFHAVRFPCPLGLPGALGWAVSQAPALV